MQQLQGHERNEARRNESEKQQSHRAIKEVHWICAERDQRSKHLLRQTLRIAKKERQRAKNDKERGKNE